MLSGAWKTLSAAVISAISNTQRSASSKTAARARSACGDYFRDGAASASAVVHSVGRSAATCTNEVAVLCSRNASNLQLSRVGRVRNNRRMGDRDALQQLHDEIL
jgi:hypothetical protein